MLKKANLVIDCYLKGDQNSERASKFELVRCTRKTASA